MQVRENDPTAPAPYTNRLALSQAWYDALHLARDHAPRAAQPARPAAPAPAARGGASAAPPPETPVARAPYRANAALASARGPARGGAQADELQAVRRAIVRRRVVRAAPPAAREARARTVVTGTAHVAVRISFSPQGLVVALACAPAQRARAGDALERARLALAARGIATVRIFA